MHINVLPLCMAIIMACQNAYKCYAIIYEPKNAFYFDRFLTKCHPSFRKQNIIYQKQDLKYF